MSSSLRKLFTTVWSFLKGLLHRTDDTPAPNRIVVHLRSRTLRECKVAVATMYESLGYENVIVLVSATSTDIHSILCVKATQYSIKHAVSKLPTTTLAAFEPLSQEVVAELSLRRMQCEF